MAAGFVALSVRPVTLALARELMPEARGAMSGLMLAIGFAVTGVASIGFGAIGDAVGIREAFLIVSGVWWLSLPFIALLPGGWEVQAMTA